mmetsp:Transcript_9685/g.12652  ORF Transcript_9685/g.12652 Transcript_9685/m.12652 type:complete len:143 (+) Transcript_9685:1136-1564(+)
MKMKVGKNKPPIRGKAHMATLELEEQCKARKDVVRQSLRQFISLNDGNLPVKESIANLFLKHTPVRTVGSKGKCGMSYPRNSRCMYAFFHNTNKIGHTDTPVCRVKCSECKITLHEACFYKYHERQGFYDTSKPWEDESESA